MPPVSLDELLDHVPSLPCSVIVIADYLHDAAEPSGGVLVHCFPFELLVEIGDLFTQLLFFFICQGLTSFEQTLDVLDLALHGRHLSAWSVDCRTCPRGKRSYRHLGG